MIKQALIKTGACIAVFLSSKQKLALKGFIPLFFYKEVCRMIGDKIKQFRIKKGITQEELGRLVGVTTQAVSKWERGGVPDAELLPNIADALNVNVDMLFGRRDSHSLEDAVIDEMLTLTREEGFKKAFSLMWCASLGISGVASAKDSLGIQSIENINDTDGNSYYSRLCLDEGIIDAKMNTNGRYYFFMPEPENGIKKMFDDIDILAKVFELFADKDILRIIFYMYSRQNIPVTLQKIASKINLDTIKTEKLMDRLCKYNLAIRTVVETEKGEIKAYTFMNETVVIPLLCFSKEISDKNVLNWGVWFDRHKPLF